MQRIKGRDPDAPVGNSDLTPGAKVEREAKIRHKMGQRERLFKQVAEDGGDVEEPLLLKVVWTDSDTGGLFQWVNVFGVSGDGGGDGAGDGGARNGGASSAGPSNCNGKGKGKEKESDNIEYVGRSWAGTDTYSRQTQRGAS